MCKKPATYVGLHTTKITQQILKIKPKLKQWNNLKCWLNNTETESMHKCEISGKRKYKFVLPKMYRDVSNDRLEIKQLHEVFSIA